MENKDAKEILGRYGRLRRRNNDVIESFIRNGTAEDREEGKAAKIEKQLREEREAGLLVLAVLDLIENEEDRQILELRFLRCRSTKWITYELYGSRKDFREHEEKYREKVNHRLGYALLTAAEVMRQNGLDELPQDDYDPDEDPEG